MGAVERLIEGDIRGRVIRVCCPRVDQFPTHIELSGTHPGLREIRSNHTGNITVSSTEVVGGTAWIGRYITAHLGIYRERGEKKGPPRQEQINAETFA